MAGAADLPSKDAAVADFRRSRKADLAAEQGIFTDGRAVPDEHKIVDFRAARCIARMFSGGQISSAKNR